MLIHVDNNDCAPYLFWGHCVKLDMTILGCFFLPNIEAWEESPKILHNDQTRDGAVKLLPLPITTISNISVCTSQEHFSININLHIHSSLEIVQRTYSHLEIVLKSL